MCHNNVYFGNNKTDKTFANNKNKELTRMARQFV